MLKKLDKLFNDTEKKIKTTNCFGLYLYISLVAISVIQKKNKNK